MSQKRHNKSLNRIGAKNVWGQVFYRDKSKKRHREKKKI